jgi:hypothetical protein
MREIDLGKAHTRRGQRGVHSFPVGNENLGGVRIVALGSVGAEPYKNTYHVLYLGCHCHGEISEQHLRAKIRKCAEKSYCNSHQAQMNADKAHKAVAARKAKAELTAEQSAEEIQRMIELVRITLTQLWTEPRDYEPWKYAR